MAIEIAAKPKIKVPFWAIFILLLSLTGFLAVGLSYFYFDSLSRDLAKKIKEKEQALIKTETEKNLEDSVFSKEEKINNLATLIKKHGKTFNIFLFLESLTHPEIQYTDFNFATGTGQVKLIGNAKSFLALGQQLLILKQKEEIKEIELSGISIREDKRIDFNLSLTFDSKIFE